jgi:hypothetical protein
MAIPPQGAHVVKDNLSFLLHCTALHYYVHFHPASVVEVHGLALPHCIDVLELVSFIGITRCWAALCLAPATCGSATQGASFSLFVHFRRLLRGPDSFPVEPASLFLVASRRQWSGWLASGRDVVEHDNMYCPSQPPMRYAFLRPDSSAMVKPLYTMRNR